MKDPLTDIADSLRQIAQHYVHSQHHALNHLLHRAYHITRRLEALGSISQLTSEKFNSMPDTTLPQFAATLNAFFDREDAAVDVIIADEKAMQDLIKTLQNSPGTFTPEDQATVDKLEARVATAIDRLEALKQTVPPTVPLK